MGEHEKSAEPVSGAFDHVGYIRRARRIADLSQRDLAARLGVGVGTVARAESANGNIVLPVLVAILAQAGLRLMVVDEAGRPVEPMNPAAARDNSGRRYPAHLDARMPSNQYVNSLEAQSRKRPERRLNYALREGRDYWRSRVEPPADHPTSKDIVDETQRRREARLRQRPQVARVEQEQCACGPECERFCVPECLCQCETPEMHLPFYLRDFG